jgi:hypothetical protein
MCTQPAVALADALLVTTVGFGGGDADTRAGLGGASQSTVTLGIPKVWAHAVTP